MSTSQKNTWSAFGLSLADFDTQQVLLVSYLWWFKSKLLFIRPALCRLKLDCKDTHDFRNQKLCQFYKNNFWNLGFFFSFWKCVKTLNSGKPQWSETRSTFDQTCFCDVCGFQENTVFMSLADLQTDNWLIDLIFCLRIVCLQQTHRMWGCQLAPHYCSFVNGTCYTACFLQSLTKVYWTVFQSFAKLRNGNKY